MGEKGMGAMDDWLKLIAVSGAVVAMLFGMYHVFASLKARESGFGRDSLRAIGLVLFLPSLVILAVATNFKPETIAALLGTVAGYVLSSSDEKKEKTTTTDKTTTDKVEKKDGTTEPAKL